MNSTVTAIGRSLWLGWFEFPPFNNSLQRLSNCSAQVSRTPLVPGILEVRSANRSMVACYVAAEQEGTVAALNREVARARAAFPGIPVIPYWVNHQSPVPDGDWIGVEAYWKLSETLVDFETRIHLAAARCENVALIAQCYTSNAAQSTDLAALVPVYARLAREILNVRAILVFSGYGRPTGLQDHPEVRPLWEKLFAGISGAPPIILPPTPAPKPKPPISEEKELMIAYGQPIAGFSLGDIVSNADGSVSVKKTNGQFLCVTPEGHVEERPNGGGPWESFKRGRTSLIAERDGRVFVLPVAE